MGAVMPSGETVEDAAKAAAYKVADAENKSFLAAEAVKEAERIAKMAEDTDSMLQIIKEMYEKCKWSVHSSWSIGALELLKQPSFSLCNVTGSRGEIILLA